MFRVIRATLCGGIVLCAGLSVSVARAQVNSSIGVNFTGSTVSESGSVPPDAQGEVGPNHIVLLINGRYEAYAKNSSGAPISGQASSLRNFWQNRGAGTVTDAFDPRILYDPYSQRWYAVSAANRRSASSGFYLGVSQSSDPTGSWSTFLVDGDANNANWLDFPMMGIDKDAIYVSNNMFTISGDVYSQNSTFVIPKSDLTSAVPTIANTDLFHGTLGSAHPIAAFDNLGPSTGNPMALFRAPSPSSLSRNVFNGSDPQNMTLGGTQITSLNSMSAGTAGRQPDGSTTLDVLDGRLQERLVRINGSIWGVHTRKVGGDDVLRWFEIDANTFAKKQEGTVALANRDLFNGSIAVNEQGDVVIGFTASGPDMNPSGASPNGYAGAYAVVGSTAAGVTTFNSPMLLQQGLGLYSGTRWGDYSSTRVDPADPNIFWTWQEYAGTASSDWRLQISEIVTHGDDEFYWTSDASGSYATTANWRNGAAPTAADHLIFSRQGNPYTVTFAAGVTTNDRADVRQGNVTWMLNAGSTLELVNTGDATAPSLAVSPFQGTSNLTLAGGGALHSRTAVVAGGMGGAAGVTLSAGTSWNNDQRLFVGSGAASTGSLLVAGALTTGSHAFLASGDGAVGSVTVVGNGAQWNAAANLYVGGDANASGGLGSLTVTGGGTLNVAGLTKIWQTGSVVVGNGGAFNTDTLEVVAGSTFSVLAGGSFSMNRLHVNSGGTYVGDVQTNGDIVLNGTLDGNVAVNVGNSVGGSGVITGNLTGAGTVGPGNSPGVLDAAQVDPTSGIDFLFQFTAANTVPDYLNRTASLNDVLHLTHASTPFLSALTSNNVITVDFQVASLNDGDYFLGGFFTNQQATDFYGDGTIENAMYNYLLNGSALDLNQWQVGVSTIAQPNVDFGSEYGGIVNGRVTRFSLTAIPEPGSLVLVGAAAVGCYLRRRKSLGA